MDKVRLPFLRAALFCFSVQADGAVPGVIGLGGIGIENRMPVPFFLPSDLGGF